MIVIGTAPVVPEPVAPAPIAPPVQPPVKGRPTPPISIGGPGGGITSIGQPQPEPIPAPVPQPAPIVAIRNPITNSCKFDHRCVECRFKFNVIQYATL